MKAVKARVQSIVDGDTIKVTVKKALYTLRLACIDAPELAQAPYGDESRDALTGLIPVGSSVTFRKTATDAFGRTVAEVFGKRKLNIGAELVRKGWAFVDDAYVSQCNADQLIDYQGQASAQKLGVWAAESLQKPWDFRQQSGDDSSGDDSTGGDPTGGGGGGGGGSLIPPFTGTRLITCGQITSRDEANRWLAAGHSYLDGDRDGCPCETQFPC